MDGSSSKCLQGSTACSGRDTAPHSIPSISAGHVECKSKHVFSDFVMVHS